MLTPGGNFQYVIMQEGATSTGDGAPMLPTNMSAGVYPILTAQVVGLSGDTITVEGTIDETNWVNLPALRITTRAVSSTITANNTGITPAEVGAVVFDTANALVAVLNAGHATNMAKLL